MLFTLFHHLPTPTHSQGRNQSRTTTSFPARPKNGNRQQILLLSLHKTSHKPVFPRTRLSYIHYLLPLLVIILYVHCRSTYNKFASFHPPQLPSYYYLTNLPRIRLHSLDYPPSIHHRVSAGRGVVTRLDLMTIPMTPTQETKKRVK